MTAGRKRRPAATSARQAVQEPLPLAPPAREDELPPREVLAELRLAPAPAEVLPRPAEALEQQTPGHWEVLWVRCEECGRGRHLDAAGRHGAMPVRGVTLAANPSWPRCPHDRPLWENCRGRPVAPPCCVGGAP